MRKKNLQVQYLWLLILPFILNGCSTADTTGNSTERNYRAPVEINNNDGGTVNWYVTINGKSEAEEMLTQTTDNDPSNTVSPKMNASLAQAGGTSSLAGAGSELLVDGVTSLFQQWQELQNEPDVPPIIIPNAPPSKIPVSDPIVPTEVVATGIFELADWSGVKDNNRPVWYFSKTMDQYPADFDIVIEGCGTLELRGNTGKRMDFDEKFKVTSYNESRNRYFVRQSEVTTDPRGMVLVGSQHCLSKKAYIPALSKKTLSTYEKDQYEDGRWRYLFRGVMEELPSQFEIHFNGERLYTVSLEGDRWQGPNDVKGSTEPLLKNSHGRVNSITLLLPKRFSSGTATLVL